MSEIRLPLTGVVGGAVVDGAGVVRDLEPFGGTLQPPSLSELFALTPGVPSGRTRATVTGFGVDASGKPFCRVRVESSEAAWELALEAVVRVGGRRGKVSEIRTLLGVAAVSTRPEADVALAKAVRDEAED